MLKVWIFIGRLIAGAVEQMKIDDNHQNEGVESKLSQQDFYSDLLEGREPRILNNSYVLGPCFLRSVTGDIHASWDKGTDRETLLDGDPEYFIKFLPDTYPHTEEAIKVFEREVEKAIDSCDGFKILAFEQDDEDAYVVYQLPPGDFLQNLMQVGRPFGNLPEVLSLVAKINTALSNLKYSTLVHGRVGVDSIYIPKEGVIGVLDSIYVSAKRRELEKNIEETTTIPNREAIYASPDACFGRKISEKDDVFSLACITYHLLSGEHPFNGVNSVSALLNKVRPQRIKSLTDEQWEHLEHGMALPKEGRLESLDAFINGFKRSEDSIIPAFIGTQNASEKQSAQKEVEKKVETKQEKRDAAQPSQAQAIEEKDSFADKFSLEKLQELEVPSWSWMPLSFLTGILAGAVVTGLAMQFFGVEAEAIKNAVLGLFGS